MSRPASSSRKGSLLAVASSPPLVAILLATHNGACFLPAQLASLERQSHAHWRVWWRDDGSADGSVGVMEHWRASHPAERLAGAERLGAAGSFMALLSAAAADPAVGYAAFCDQDDEWPEDKLARSLALLAGVEGPALLCGRQLLIDENGRPAGLSPLPRRSPGIGNALVQNIAVGCTILLNRAAIEAVLAAPMPADFWHDWWCYARVCAVGGRVIYSPAPLVRYRQHGGNLLGDGGSLWRRGWRAARGGGVAYLSRVAALASALRLAGDGAAETLRVLAGMGALAAPCFWRRWRGLRRSGLYRQSRFGDLGLVLLFWRHRLPRV